MTLSSFFKAGALALMVSTAALVALPAQAASPSLSLSFGFGTQNGLNIYDDDNGYDGWRYRHHAHFWDRETIEAQLSDDYDDVSYLRMQHGDYVFVGRRGHTWFQLVVDADTGHVRAKRIHRDTNGDGNFSLSLSY